MAAPAQSPLRRWKRFFGAFDDVDAAIKAAEPDLSRGEFRRARGDVFELLCNAADDDDHAERLCRVLDDMMAGSLETLRLIPAMPTVLASTGLASSLLALRKHESERVRVLASGIVSGWRASMQDDLAKVREAMHKLDKVLQHKEIIDHQQPSTKEITADPADATAKQTSKILESSAKPKRTATIVGSDRVKTATIAAQLPLHKNTVEMAKKTSDPSAAGVVRGDRAGLCSEERLEAAKRKFRDAYKEAEDAKRQRRTQKVEAPEMLKQRQKMQPIIPTERNRAKCASSIVKKTFSITRLAS